MINKQAAVIVRPYLEKLDLSAESMYSACAQFTALYVGSCSGVLDAGYGDRAVALLDYHLGLLVRK